jgi:hypothetical protein
MVVKEHDKDAKHEARHEPPKAPATERATGKTATPEVTGIPPDQVSTDPEGYPYIDSLRLLVTLGPWKDAVLHFPNADAAQAIADKWAIDFEEKPHDPDATPVPLTEAEYTAALAAAEQYVKDHVEPPAEDEPAARGAAPKGRGRERG